MDNIDLNCRKVISRLLYKNLVNRLFFNIFFIDFNI